ncbi:MAG: helix-turn-helix domain containing protein [Proteobacteria bacterium]|nr:helix-turn-helix domain containing protein [Pseudomonadota bacterium]
MAGVREQQKQKRRDAIFRAAAGLFAQRGYSATTVEDIARAAGISVPTLYAYVPSKAGLVVALYESDRALIDACKQALVARPSRDPARAIAALLLLEMKDGQDWLGHDVWREVVSSAIRGAGDFQADLERLNQRVFDVPLARLLERLVARGDLRPGLDIGAAVALFSDLVMAVFHQELVHDHPWPWVEQRIRRHVKVALAGMMA